MKTIKRITIPAIFIALSLGSCSLMAPKGIDPSDIQANKGSIAITIKSPLMESIKIRQLPSPAVAGAYAQPVSRAISCLSSCTAEVRDELGTLIASHTYTDLINDDYTFIVPAGDYVVAAEVFNSTMSPTVPVVSGTTDVTVVAGAPTVAAIVCLPTSTTALGEAAWTPDNSFVQAQSNPATGASWGTERWYTFTPSLDAIQVTTDSTGCFPAVGLFDQQGILVSAQYLNTGMDSATFAVASGASYYIAILSYMGDGTVALMAESISPVAVTGVAVFPDTLSIEVAEWQILTAVISPPGATNQNVTWTSSNEAIVLADPSGIVFGVAAGAAVVTARTEDGNFTDTCAVTVTAPAAMPYDAWGTTPLDGGADAAAAVSISLDNWYSSSVAFPDTVWYSLTVSTTNTYEVYWDDAFEGSGIYTGDVVVYAYNSDGTVPYGDADSGYQTPLIINPTETTILICVDPVFGDGSFAVGVYQQ